jgi:hypothetical protein
MDEYNKIKNKYRKSVKNLVDKHGNEKIIKMIIRKYAIWKVAVNFLNITTKGHFERLYNKFNNDKISHYYIWCKTDNNTIFTLEKINGFIMVNSKYCNFQEYIHENDKKSFLLDQNGNNPTVMELLENTRKYMGDEKYFNYECYDNNCTVFIESIIKSNNMDNEEGLNFININIKKIVSNIPSNVRPFSMKTYKLIDKITKIINRFFLIKDKFL